MAKIQLVVEIDELIYKFIKAHKKEKPFGWLSTKTIVTNAIINGKPLPKGHGDLKDADIYKSEVKKYITENKNSDDLYLAGCGDGAYHALHIYDCIPTIIEADKEGE